MAHAARQQTRSSLGGEDDDEDAKPVLPTRPKSYHRPAPEPPMLGSSAVTFTPVEPLSLKPHTSLQVRLLSSLRFLFRAVLGVLVSCYAVLVSSCAVLVSSCAVLVSSCAVLVSSCAVSLRILTSNSVAAVPKKHVITVNNSFDLAWKENATMF